MSRHKKRVALLLAFAAVVAATAATIAGTAIARTAAGTLNIYGSGPGDDVQENRASYAKDQLSGTSISRPSGDFNDQVFLTRLASGDVPDLVRMSRPRVGTYIAKGVLQQLDSCIPQAVRKDYRVGAMKAMTYGGHVYGVPEFTQPVTLVVNQSAFRAAGVPISEAQTKDKKKLLAATKRLVKFDSNGNLTRIGFDPKVDSFIFFMLWVKWYGKDKNLISADGLKAQVNSKEAVAALAYALQLINAQGGWNKFKAFRDTFDFFGRGNPYAKDQLAFSPLESFFYNAFSNNTPDVDILAKFFQNRKGGAMSVFSGNGWVVPKGSKNVADACAYMKAVTSTPAWLFAAKQRYDARKRTNSTFTGLYTANTEADKKIYEDIYQSFGHPQFDRAVQVIVQAGKYGFEMPPSPGGAQLVDAVNSAVLRALTGQQSPKAALDQAQREAQAAINANR